MSKFRPVLRFVMAAALAASAAACATAPPEEAGFADEVNDPLEPFNRQMFAVNLTLDTFILRPAAVGYTAIVPAFGKTAVRNFVNTPQRPTNLTHNTPQGHGDEAHIDQ